MISTDRCQSIVSTFKFGGPPQVSIFLRELCIHGQAIENTTFYSNFDIFIFDLKIFIFSKKNMSLTARGTQF